MAQDGKETVCSAGDWDLIPLLGRSHGRREWLPTPAFLPGTFHGLRSLMDYSLWSYKVSDMTEQLTQTHSVSKTCKTNPPPPPHTHIKHKVGNLDKQKILLLATTAPSGLIYSYG